jgi:hypothetical protein
VQRPHHSQLISPSRSQQCSVLQPQHSQLSSAAGSVQLPEHLKGGDGRRHAASEPIFSELPATARPSQGVGCGVAQLLGRTGLAEALSAL